MVAVGRGGYRYRLRVESRGLFVRKHSYSLPCPLSLTLPLTLPFHDSPPTLESSLPCRTLTRTPREAMTRTATAPHHYLHNNRRGTLRSPG